MPTVRRATAEDGAFLREVLAIAADWRPGIVRRPVAEIMSEPALAHYISGWPARGDVGFIADNARPVGAVWWRFFTEADQGYGFVDDATPEVSIGIVAESRGQGIGTLLLETLIEEGLRRDLPALSLSVEPANPAVTLYQRLGFIPVGHSGGAVTMILKLVA